MSEQNRGVQNRDPLVTPTDDDYSVQVTWIPGESTALLTVRHKDRELTREQLRAVAAALLEASDDLGGST